jgi:hypothetical protein
VTKQAHQDVVKAMRAPRLSANGLGPELEIHAAMAALSAIYEEVLEDVVFQAVVESPASNKKEELKYRRTLRDPEVQTILAIIWKESDFVDKQSLDEAGFNKTFDDRELTVYGLATKLASSQMDLARVNSRIRSICMAAEYFGLIERERTTLTRGLVRGTEKLHILMLAIAGHAESILSKRSSLRARKAKEKA